MMLKLTRLLGNQGPSVSFLFPACIGKAHFSPQLKLGTVLRKEKTFSLDEVKKYSELSQDKNPIHLHKDFAVNSGFQDCVVHGMLTAALFPSIIASHFPGAIYISQILHFRAPLCVGESVVAEVHALEIREYKQKYRAKFTTKCFRKEGMLPVLDGEALALLPSLPYSKQDGYLY